jgi:hypothetical protein
MKPYATKVSTLILVWLRNTLFFYNHWKKELVGFLIIAQDSVLWNSIIPVRLP